MKCHALTWRVGRPNRTRAQSMRRTGAPRGHADIYPGEGCVMSIEYIASISEAEYKMFRIVMTTELPDDYQMWLRVRERGKLTALTEHGTSVTEIEVSLVEFAAYAKGLKNPNFSIGALDQCARRKAMAKAQAPAASQGGLATPSINAPSRRQLDSNDARSNAGRSRGDNNHHSTQADKDRDRIRNHSTDSHSRVRNGAL